MRLGAGERCFDIEILLDAIFVRKDASHRLGRKYVAENPGAHSNGGHSSTFRGQQADRTPSLQNGPAAVYLRLHWKGQSWGGQSRLPQLVTIAQWRRATLHTQS